MGIGFFESKNEKGEPQQHLGFKTESQINNAKEEIKDTQRIKNKIDNLKKTILEDQKEIQKLEEFYKNGFHTLEKMYETLETVLLFLDKLKKIETRLVIMYSELIKSYNEKRYSDSFKLKQNIAEQTKNSNIIINKLEPIINSIILKPSHEMYRDDKKRNHLKIIDKKAKIIWDDVLSVEKNIKKIYNDAQNYKKDDKRKIGFKI